MKQKQQTELTGYVTPDELNETVEGIIRNSNIISITRTTYQTGLDIKAMYLIIYEELD